MFKNIKYDIYQNLGIYFPMFFKKKMFSNLNDSLKKGSDKLPPEKELLILQLFINKASIVIDVGANNGLYCHYFQHIIGAKEIHAFEPIPTLYLKLTKWFKNIHFYPFAVSDKKSETLLRIPYINSIKYETRAKLDSLVEKDETDFKEIAIQTETLDCLFLNKLTSLDFIKIDIEGHELKAVMGAEELINKHHPVLMIEIEERHHSSNLTSVIETIENLGYECCFFDYSLKKIVSFTEFDLQKHQNVNATDSTYINNFLFLPLNSYIINDLNDQIKTILN